MHTTFVRRTTSHSFTENRRGELERRGADPVAAALEELGKVRDAARERLFEFSAATLHKWRELEAEIDNKLESLETRMAEGGETAFDVAVARINELTRAIHELVESHLQCSAHALMSTNVRVCSPDDSLETVAHLLWDADCGALPVVDHSGKLVAMITDRDVCMATYIQGCAPSAVRVEHAMSKQVHSCSPDESLPRICGIMSDHQVRRVPVVDTAGHLVGVVSVADIARFLSGLPADHPSRQLLVTALAAICGRRSTAKTLAPVSATASAAA